MTIQKKTLRKKTIAVVMNGNILKREMIVISANNKATVNSM